MNLHSVVVCKEGEKEVQRMLDAGIIFRVSTSYLVSPIALNKNEKMRRLTKTEKSDKERSHPFPLSFQDVILA